MSEKDIDNVNVDFSENEGINNINDEINPFIYALGIVGADFYSGGYVPMDLSRYGNNEPVEIAAVEKFDKMNEKAVAFFERVRSAVSKFTKLPEITFEEGSIADTMVKSGVLERNFLKELKMHEKNLDNEGMGPNE